MITPVAAWLRGIIKTYGLDIRIDTHACNRPMLAWINKQAFIYCGIIRVENGTERLAFQLKVK